MNIDNCIDVYMYIIQILFILEYTDQLWGLNFNSLFI